MSRPGGGRPGSRSNLRLIGGELRGRRLTVPEGVRPSEARVRAALFSIWQPRLAGCRFLDLFAGTGAAGLEAVSRGAAGAVFVEHDPRVLTALRRNCDTLAPERCRISRQRLPAALDRPPEERFDLIFADPPYSFAAYEALLHGAAAWLAPGGELAIEHSARREVAAVPPWQRVDERRYGETQLSFYRLPDAAADG